MIREISYITENIGIRKDVFLLKVSSELIAAKIQPGQFCNLKVSDSGFPLLRRPFSICDVNGGELTFMILNQGGGTKILSKKKAGEKLDLLGPLGNGFNLNGDYSTAVFVAGGIGAAPFPYLNKLLKDRKKIISLSGGRTSENIIEYGMDNIFIAADDGSAGFRGNVVQLFESKLKEMDENQIKVFGCGPTPMLRALQRLCNKKNILCELSTESAMACGFGICQGCPIESADDGRYKLICSDGPVFNSKEVII